jgi:hypothetical protein
MECIIGQEMYVNGVMIGMMKITIKPVLIEIQRGLIVVKVVCSVVVPGASPGLTLTAWPATSLTQPDSGSTPGFVALRTSHNKKLHLNCI